MQNSWKMEILSDSPNSQSSQILATPSNMEPVDELDEDWEIATEDDANSGNFEVAD